jgi:hypothetical protein
LRPSFEKRKIQSRVAIAASGFIGKIVIVLIHCFDPLFIA